MHDARGCRGLGARAQIRHVRLVGRDGVAENAIVREENAIGAAEKTWGETSGAQAWKESKPPAGGLSTAVATGHAGGISTSRGPDRGAMCPTVQ